MFRSDRAVIVSLAAICAAYPANVLNAETIRVPQDQPTIQAGIDAAVDGDEVLVADGIYTGDGNRDIDFRGKSILLRSENGAANCIIDCAGSEDDPHRGFVFHTGETSLARLEGFTIQNGYVNHDSPRGARGAGIYCKGSSPTIANCTVVGNVATGEYFSRGGGVYADTFSNPTFVNCTLIRNYSSASDGSYGGAIYCAGAPELIGCNITDNRADFGAAVYCFNGKPTITDCTITDNFAYYGGGGIGCYAAEPTITDCTFARNTTEGAGGAIFCESAASVTLNNCRIYDNRAWSGGAVYILDDGRVSINNSELTGNRAEGADRGFGGAISSAGELTVRNCTFARNQAAGRGGAIDSTGRFSAANSIFWDDRPEEIAGQAAVTYCDVQSGFPGLGNIDADPLFADPENGDFHLLPDSPCIDTGDPAFVPQPGQTDMDNQMRLWDGDNDGLRRVDMGADEFASHVFGDLNCDGSLDLIDVEPFVLALIDEPGYERRYPDCERLLGDANFDGSLDLTDVEGFIELLLG